MSLAEQARTKIQITEEMISKLTFIIPEDLAPTGPRPLIIFHGDDLDYVLPEKEHPLLHMLCAELVPRHEHHCVVDHVRISRYRRETKVEVQLTSAFTAGCR